jgi:sulfide:quinone oxidoreductase
MTKRIVILGGGTGGTLVANRLRRALPADCSITVVDADDEHVYQPGLLFVPFGLAPPERLVRSRSQQLHRGISFVDSQVDSVDIAGQRVLFGDSTVLPYDVLVVATGAALLPEETEGLTGAGWLDSVFTFYDLPGAVGLGEALQRFAGGRLVINIVDLPIKCPVAPLEFCFLADWWLTERGVRDHVDLTFATPLDAAFTTPVAAETLGGLLTEKNIAVVTEFNTSEVRGDTGELVSFDGRTLDFDLAVVVPVHGGQHYVGRSPGLGDALGFVPTDPHTLQSTVHPAVFALGDATDLVISKAGSVAHFEGETVVNNVRQYLNGRPLLAGYDGHASCFVETGYGKALFIDFNYDLEPVPGHYPGRVGLPLLRESRLNHIGKRLFERFYWNAMLPGRDVPGIHPAMPRSGKELVRP